MKRKFTLCPRTRAYLVTHSAELFILIVLGSVPTLKPVYQRFIHGQKDFGRGKRYPSNKFFQLGSHTNKPSTSPKDLAKPFRGSSRPDERSLSAERDEVGVHQIEAGYGHTFEVSAGADDTTSITALRKVDSSPTVAVSHSVV